MATTGCIRRQLPPAFGPRGRRSIALTDWTAARVRGGPPVILHADRGYDHNHLHALLRILEHRVPHRTQGHRILQRLGGHRWVVERTVAWLNGFHRLYRCYEHRADHFLGFVGIGSALICYRHISN